MAKRVDIFCSHNMKILADRFMIIHQYEVSLCDSVDFRDSNNKIYDRVGVRTGTPINFPW